MTTDPLTDQLAALTAGARSAHPGVFASYGPNADIDAAFDEAAAAAGNEHGFTGAHPSLASADADAVEEVTTPSLPGPAVALRLSADLAAGVLTPGVVYAYPVSVPSAVTRRRARLTLTQVDLLAPLTPGRIADLDEGLRQAIVAGLGESGGPLEEGESLESVDVVRNRSRFKPVVEVFRTKGESTHVLIDPLTNVIVAGGFPNAGAARREAVARAKAGPLSSAGTDPELGGLEVFKLSGREGGFPLLRVARSRIKAQVIVKVVLIREKNPDKTRRAGWLFAGVAAPPAPEQDDSDAAVGTEAAED